MLIFFGIGLLLISFFLVLIPFVFVNENEDIIPSAILGGITMLFLILGIVFITEYCSPSITPMDVYQGKTTLEYTVVDGVKVDSCVIWKNKE